MTETTERALRESRENHSKHLLKAIMYRSRKDNGKVRSRIRGRSISGSTWAVREVAALYHPRIGKP